LIYFLSLKLSLNHLIYLKEKVLTRQNLSIFIKEIFIMKNIYYEKYVRKKNTP